jgi:hypothetical protein
MSEACPMPSTGFGALAVAAALCSRIEWETLPATSMLDACRPI